MNNFYVYIHRKKSNNEIFYVGKGKDRRAYWKSRRNQYWQNIVNKYGYIVEILKDNLTENEAFKLEIQTIEQYRNQNIKLCNMSEGGEGRTGAFHSKETKEKIAIHLRGKNNPRYINEIYTFVNHYTSEEFVGTKNDLMKKLNIGNDNSTIYRMVNKKDRSYFGWTLKGQELGKPKDIKGKLNHMYGLKGRNSPISDLKIYKFEKDGIIEICNKFDLGEKYGIKTNYLSRLIKGEKRTIFGWKFLGVAETTPKT